MRVCVKRLCKVLAGVFVVAVLASEAGAQDSETAEEVFHEHISGPIVQSRCVNCHVQGGVSGHTRLVFVHRSEESDHEALNLRTFENLLDAVADEGGGGSYILNKIQGVSHGGGAQVPAGSVDFANMEWFLRLLGEGAASVAALTPQTLFDTVVLASPRKTLRRAALIFAGRLPTEAEYAAVEGGDESVLRATIRGLMEGPQFHEFLLRASNDRLLTDGKMVGIDPNVASFVDFTNEYYRRVKIAEAIDDERAWNDLGNWHDRTQFGFRRAPLELIAHVAENDLPYTEILTADYIMANPWAAAAYGAPTQFDDSDDVHEFKKSRIVSYYRKGDGFEEEYDPISSLTRVLDPGPLLTTYPHAGILNTTAFLQRYPTTATNRNRARARWTYYHFLGLDVEKSASRTTDPVALADTNNPTMHNPACTVCHSVLDPVAGAFQNYSDEGYYKHAWGGLDSLDDLYKEKEGPSLTTAGGSWTDREALVWPVSLAAGVQTLRVMFTNPASRNDNAGAQRYVYLDRLNVTDADGDVVVSHEFEDLGPPVAHWGRCGETYYNRAGRPVALWLHWGGRHCAIYIDVQIPANGVYTVEIVAWSIWNHRYGDRYVDGEAGFAEFSVGANGYEEGDTWYRDMRVPGFDGEAAPDSDNSVQWLAQQIVADPRFAEATVKFWWPAIMGSEVAEPPEDERDADFEGRLLAFNAQDAEVERLANGFRDGFQGSPYTYNLKDLLVEIVLSEWFRTDALTDADPVRRVALRDAGARRLLTPEELARKTAAVTGFQWGRHVRTNCWPECNRIPNALADDYRLLYGGIDSDGITERGRAITSVMAGVAKRHAVQVSCPVVMREFYLLPEAGRRLFSGVAPDQEIRDSFEIEADSRANRETLSLSGALTAGKKIVRLTFLNDYWHETEGGRNVYLDRLEVRNDAGRVVTRRELEEFGPSGDCNHAGGGDSLALYCRGSVDVSADIPTAGNYTIEVSAWADHAGDQLPRLMVTVLDTEDADSGADAIRGKLVELHDKLLGVEVTPDSPDVEAAYQLFVDVLQRKRQGKTWTFEWGWHCDFSADIFFYEGILDNAVVQREEDGDRWYEFDWDRIEGFMDGIDFSDPHHTAQAWVVVLTAMMMDYRYLYL